MKQSLVTYGDFESGDSDVHAEWMRMLFWHITLVPFVYLQDFLHYSLHQFLSGERLYPVKALWF